MKRAALLGLLAICSLGLVACEDYYDNGYGYGSYYGPSGYYGPAYRGGVYYGGYYGRHYYDDGGYWRSRDRYSW